MASEDSEIGARAVDSPPGVSAEAVRGIVADPERRHLLRLLREFETPEHVSALARNLAQDDPSESPHAGKIQLRVEQVHVPLLETCGLVDYYGGRGLVELTESGRTLADQLAHAD